MNEMKNGGASLEIWNVTWSGNGSGFWGEKKVMDKKFAKQFYIGLNVIYLS